MPIDCPCGYGKNIKPDQDKCHVCGADLTPLHRFYKLPDHYLERANKLIESGKSQEAVEALYTCISLSNGTNNEAKRLLDEISLNNKQALQHYKEGKSRVHNHKPKIVFSIILGLAILIIGINKINPGKSIIIPTRIVADQYYSDIHNYPYFDRVMIVTDDNSNTINVSGEVKSDSNKALLIEASRKLDNRVKFAFDQLVVKQEPLMIHYTVRQGDSLSSISQSFYKDEKRWVDILKANNETIGNPDHIIVGQELLIPVYNY